MPDIFISHAEEDHQLVADVARGLEADGFSTWYYERDTLPGVSYLIQTGRAIQECQAIVLIISSHSIRSVQVTKEVVRGHETGKPFVPVLVDMSHTEFQERQPEWREAIGSAASMPVPQKGVHACLPRLIEGLRALPVKPSRPTDPTPIASAEPPHPEERPVRPGKLSAPYRPAGAEAATASNRLRQPFGEESCEHEVALLKESYPDYYFNEAPFNLDALDPETYLIVGRRGCGKTSLAHYFRFQTLLKNARSIVIEEPQIYEQILAAIERVSYPPGLSTASIASIWECFIWSLIFQKYQDADSCIAQACPTAAENASPTSLLQRLLGDDLNECYDRLQQYLRSSTFAHAEEALLRITEKAPVILAVDTLEKYDRENEPMMRATAALIECASRFNVGYSTRGIHVKTFLSAEISPHVKESAISNTSKFIRNELYLHWRPKDLVRLVCWRFHSYLEHQGMARQGRHEPVDWTSFPEVLKKRWIPCFKETVRNSSGLEERTFPYVLRHTQMRPRQLVILCNQIARHARQGGAFPNIPDLAMVGGVATAQRRLSDEVLNCYSERVEKVRKWDRVLVWNANPIPAI